MKRSNSSYAYDKKKLYKAIKNYSQGRVFLNGKKTIVFKGDKIL